MKGVKVKASPPIVCCLEELTQLPSSNSGETATMNIRGDESDEPFYLLLSFLFIGKKSKITILKLFAYSLGYTLPVLD